MEFQKKQTENIEEMEIRGVLNAGEKRKVRAGQVGGGKKQKKKKQN